VQRFSRGEIDAVADRWNALVDGDRSIDRWCSSTDWCLPVNDAFNTKPPTNPSDSTHQGTGTFVGLADETTVAMFTVANVDDDTTALMGPDVVWAYSTAMVTSSPSTGVAAVVNEVEILAAEHGVSFIVFPGLFPSSSLERTLLSTLMTRTTQVGIGMGVSRNQAMLDGGVEAFLGRRSGKFRRNLRRALDAAAAAGMKIETADPTTATVASTMDRILKIESTSWKGREGSGLVSSEMATCFADMTKRCATRNAARVSFAVIDGGDVGYILGGIRGTTYRGMQISYNNDRRDLSIGHLLQWHEVQRCIADGMRLYDLGMPLPYKEHWSDGEMITRSIVARRWT
jgi:hypothetical protein